MSRYEYVGRKTAGQHSDKNPAVVKEVSVAVLAPRLIPGMNQTTGVARGDIFGWEELNNWRKPTDEEEEADRAKLERRKKSVIGKMLPTTRRERKDPDMPPFVLKQVPFETWRKHYAKDKDGNYRGTHAPALDCLLKPADLEKWRYKEGGGDDAPKGALKWTRGPHALPVYAEVEETAKVPDYEAIYDGDNLLDMESYDRPPPGEPVVDPDTERYDRPPAGERTLEEADEDDEDEEQAEGSEATDTQRARSAPPSALSPQAGRMQSTSTQSSSSAARFQSISTQSSSSAARFQSTSSQSSSTEPERSASTASSRIVMDPNSGLPYDAEEERKRLLERNKKGLGFRKNLQKGVEWATFF